MLLYFLFRKKPLTWPFVLMIFGVIACFVGLLLSSPLTETTAAFISTETYL
ncbi:hypothetical protein [Marinococcus sp. PL1-022]|uniref:hypothetical protein n=1 Tax=Marinococcus sp. PL1-022 TaxID=3095363 RepID=UPI00263707C8|nr:hypothetical protein [Marinococcus sp. PL1-022]MDX6153024.1 hypothetical protein [Marinococcus sp. PL1-022]